VKNVVGSVEYDFPMFQFFYLSVEGGHFEHLLLQYGKLCMYIHTGFS
jgi:hypothetical protein